MTVKRCVKGHQKELRRYGWYCVPCERLNRLAREEKAFVEGRRKHRLNETKKASLSVPVDQLCKRGHRRVMRPSGRLACPQCQNAFSNARRKLLRANTCPHIEEPGFEGIVSDAGVMVCLACLADEANAV